MSLRDRLLAATFLLAAACTSSTEPTAAPTPTPTSSEDPSPPPDDPHAAACATETANLQLGLEKTHLRTTDVVLAVKNETCGIRVLASGPSKVDPSKLHRIGSVTKTYVAAVILSLAQKGTLSLDDKLSKHVSDVPGGDVISVRQLLNHTSGLFNYTEDPKFIGEVLAGKKTTPRAIVDGATKHSPYFAPGNGWHYSNTNFVLLGMIAEKVSGAKIGALVRTHVLEKSGLKGTFFDGEEPLGAELAKGRGAGGEDVTNIADPSWAWAAGAMTATPGDVLTWIEKLGSGTFHEPAMQKELLTTVKTDASAVGYGLGIMVFNGSITAGAGQGIGHGGDIMGYHTQAFYFPQKKTTIVAIVDSDAEDPNEVSLSAIKTLFGKK